MPTEAKFPEYLVGIVPITQMASVHSLLLSLPSSAVKILLCLLLIGFTPVCRIGLVGYFVINIPECIILRFRCTFLGVRVFSNFLHHSDNCGYLLPSDFAFTTPIVYPPSPQCFESMDVKTECLCSTVS